ncbi:MAG: hypothetical protein JWM32_324 [Verrucomicrobia bacterium]|nr:hypothetical protein [Verrucomicrobiota bacterium]
MLWAAVFPAMLSAADEATFEIYVRSKVEQPMKGMAREHGRIYGIIAMSQIVNAEEKLIKPMNETELLRQLHQVMLHRGFHEAPKGTKPDILLTVLYGRSWMRNPYLEDDLVQDINEDLQSAAIAGLPTHYMNQTEAGHEEKLQRAQKEKLIIDITAWRFPTNPSEKRRQLWHTTISTDDPDHQDLNRLSEKMLIAGSTYFDRKTDKPEVSISSEFPEGRVLMGTPTVIEPAEERK